MQVNTVNVELSIAKSHYVGYMHVTYYKTYLQCQNLNYLTLKSSIQNEWTLVSGSGLMVEVQVMKTYRTMFIFGSQDKN
jgi:hypothetical protein